MTGDAPLPEAAALGAGFPQTDVESWRVKARAALGNADDAGLEALVRRTRDGLVRGPVMTRADRPTVSPGRLWRAAGALDNRVAIRASSPGDANTRALEALEGGATSIELSLPHATLEDLDRALDGVVLAAAAVALADADAATAGVLPALWAQRGVSPGSVRGALNIDPLRSDAELDAAAALAATLAEAGSSVVALRVDARVVHEAGGTEAAELAWAAAGGAAALEALVRRGLSIDVAAQAVAFAVALDADTHLGVAKLRALRRLWSRIVTAAEGAEPAAVIQARSSDRMLTAADPSTNLLRLTAVAMAAALGGADSISLAPYTAEDTPRARRLSRNIPLIIAFEASLDAVEDPAQGSFHHEALTERLAEAAWTRFQAIMGAGGPAALLASGRPLRELLR